MANYKDAGVDVEAGYKAVRLMKEHVGKTFRKEVLTGLGGFGSLFELDLSKFEQPVLISGTDGVGTKLKISFLTDNMTPWESIVWQCVSMTSYAVEQNRFSFWIILQSAKMSRRKLQPL